MDPFATLTSVLIRKLAGKEADELMACFEKTDVEKAILRGKQAIKEWEKESAGETPLLGHRPQIIDEAFQDSRVLDELAKPWKKASISDYIRQKP